MGQHARGFSEPGLLLQTYIRWYEGGVTSTRRRTTTVQWFPAGTKRRTFRVRHSVPDDLASNESRSCLTVVGPASWGLPWGRASRASAPSWVDSAFESRFWPEGPRQSFVIETANRVVLEEELGEQRNGEVDLAPPR